ncbi:MAG: dihydroxy-acid dehydratase domain-containing protein, partial [Promethearchaeota archaeon]
MALLKQKEITMDLMSKEMPIPLSPQYAYKRALYHGCGYSSSDLQKPIIAIANSYNRMNPGHIHLQKLGDLVISSIKEHGGTPMEFNTIAICDGIANNGDQSKFVLPSRDLIAASVEAQVKSHGFDGLVCIASCDKIIPGMIMGAIRCNLPTIFLTGGIMKTYNHAQLGEVVTSDIKEAMGKWNAGKMTENLLNEIIEGTCSAGACNMMGTACTMASMVEAMGLSIPNSALVEALSEEQFSIVSRIGSYIMTLVEKKIPITQIITPNSLENAIRIALAIGGSSNMVLHSLAIAYELGLSWDHFHIEQLSQRTPLLVKLKPSSSITLTKFHGWGGIIAVLKELSPLLNLECQTVLNQPMVDVINQYYRTSSSASSVSSVPHIYSLTKPLHPRGGIAILKGNLAPEGCVVKESGVHPDMLHHRGP